MRSGHLDSRRWAAGLAALLVLSGSCTDQDPSPEADSETDAKALAIPPGDVAIPPTTVDGQDLTVLSPVDSRFGSEGFRGPIFVSRTDDGVVAATVIDEEIAATSGFPDLRDSWDPGPIIDGKGPSWVTAGFGPFSMPSLMFSFMPGDVLVELASRDLSVTQLAEVASKVTVPLEEAGAVPGDLIGALTGTFQLALPGAVNAQYQGDGRGMFVTIAAATPEQQAAILALTYDDPEATIDPMTESSCCSEQVLVRPRHRTIRGARATIATLTPHIVVLVLEGDSGIVITTSPPQAGEGIPVDDQLVAIAERVHAGSPGELDALIQTVKDGEIDRQVARITQREAQLGWRVLAEHRSDEVAALITTGDTGRPELGLTEPAVCAVLDSGNQPPCLTGSSDKPITLASPGVDIFFGAIREDVDAVELVFPKGGRSAFIYDLDIAGGLPTRVFVATLDLDEQGRLTDNFNAAADAVIVARDAHGAELARVPTYEHLQP